MAGYKAGNAFISIAPSFRGFNTKVAAYMKSLRPVNVPVEFKASSKPILPPPVRNPKIKPEVDNSSAFRQIRALESRLDRLGRRGRFSINVGIAFSPLAIPALAAGAGALGGVAAIGAAGIAGAGGMAAVGGAALKRALEGQKALKEATEARTAAAAGLRSAQVSLASAVRAASQSQVASARAVADAERAVVDARRNGAQAVKHAEEALSAARRQAAQVARDSQQAIIDAQAELVDSQNRVRASLEDLHAAREQAKRDLDELAERTRDNALSIEGAEISLIEAQQRAAEVMASETATALDLRKARLAVAEAEDRLSDARRQAEQDAAKLAAAEKAGIEGSAVVQAAQESVQAAREQEAAARQGVTQARQDARRARREAAAMVTDAEQALAAAEVSAARGVADAQRNLSRARQDAAAAAVDAAASVAAAQAGVAAAEATLAEATQARQTALEQLSPAQQAAIRGVDRLKKAWSGFLDRNDPAVLGALVKGMDALRGALPALTRFMQPVARATGQMFEAIGNAAASKEFQRFARDFGRFSAVILKDAGAGIVNLARGFGNLLRAFMPLGRDMSAGLVRLTERFADWSATLGESKGFKAFIGYVRETGPLLMATLEAIGVALIAVGKALAPLAAAMLRGVKSFAEWVAQTAEAHPTLVRVVAVVGILTAGITALAKPLSALVGVGHSVIGMGIKLWKVAKVVVFNLRILWMVLRANPLGLVITIIGLLVAGFILAYKKSETFRNIVDGAMRAIADVSKWMWRNVLKPVLGFLVDAFKATWDAAVAMKDGIVAAWEWIKEKVWQANLWIVDKLSWFAEKVLSMAVKAFGWAPGIGDKLKAAHEKVKEFRQKVNAELDAISDEEVKIRVAISENQQKKSDRMMDRLGGGGPLPATVARGRMHGGMGGSGVLPRLITDKSALGDITAEASARAKVIAARLQKELREQAATSGTLGPAGKAGRVLPRGSYRIGMPYLGYPGHYGADYPAPTGTPVYTPWAGRVTASYDLPGSNPYNSTPYRSYGRVVKVQYANGATGLFAHLSSRIGSVGQVAAGQMIGRVGMNGNATGPHLHYEHRTPGGGTVNPAGLGLFDAGGLARTAGLMAKGPLPERVLSPQQTEAFERALDRNFDDGAVLSELQSQSARLASIEQTVAYLPTAQRDITRQRTGRN